MVNALWITLIGMGLVFVAILVLWGLMALLVRLTAEPEEPAADESAAKEPVAQEAEPKLRDQKRRAAAAAVALALSMRRPSTVNARPAGTVSAWQAVNRAGQLNQHEKTSRKKVVR